MTVMYCSLINPTFALAAKSMHFLSPTITATLLRTGQDASSSRGVEPPEDDRELSDVP